MKVQTDTAEAIAQRLAGTAAKLQVMAAAFQPDAETPANEIIEAALVSLADEVTAAQEDLLAVVMQEAQK